MWLGRLPPTAAVFWIGLTLGGLVISSLLLRTQHSSKARSALGRFAAAVPLLCVLATVVCLRSGVDPVIRHNSAAQRTLAQHWYAIWPYLMLAAIAGGLISMGLAATGRHAHRVVRPWIVVALLNVYAIWAVYRNWPAT